MKTTPEYINCVSCGKSLDNFTSIPGNINPMGGLRFRTYGNYGSTTFDPVTTGEHLDVAICDFCVIKNVDNIYGSGKKELNDNVDILVDATERHG